jgi:hypothetical protein
MKMRLLHRLAIMLTFVASSACVPLHSSASDVTGRWQVECEGGGKETIDLTPDGRYVYTIESPHRHMRVEGSWKIEPARGRLESADIILNKAPMSCDDADVKGAGQILDPVWEWGHTELSFHPDLGGFRRVSSPR